MAISRRDVYLVLRARDEASRIIRGFGRDLEHAAGRIQQFGAAAISTGIALTAIGVAGLNFMKANIDIAAEYERQARKTLTQVDGIKASLEDVADIGRRVAREIGVPFETLQETLFFIFSSMDVNLKEAETLLRGFAKEAVAGQTDITVAARTSIAIMNALKIPVSELNRLQDVQFQIVRKGIISYEELSNVLGRALPATAAAGQSIETLGAMMAFLTRGGLSAAMSATSAARALESLAHPKVVERLEGMGIAVRDASGEFLPLVDILRQMDEQFGHLTRPEQAKLLQELLLGARGTIQARRFWTRALRDFEDFETMFGHMENASGVFENAYGIMAESVATKSELIRNKWLLIREALGAALIPAFLKLLGLLEKGLEWFDKLPKPIKELIAQFIVWGSIAAVVIGVILILVGTLAFFVAGMILAGKFIAIMAAAIAGIIIGITAFAAAVYFAWKNSVDFRQILRNIWETIKSLARIFIDFAKGVKASFDEHLKPALSELWTIFKEQVLPVIRELVEEFREHVVPAAKEVADFFQDVVKKAFEIIGTQIEEHLIPAIQSLIEWYNENRDWVNKVIQVMVTLGKWILKIAGAAVIGILVAAISAIIQIVTHTIRVWKILISAVKTLTQWWKNIIGWLKSVWDWFKKVASAVGSAGSKVKKVGKQLRTAIASFFRNPLGMLYNAGRNIIQGLINGIKSKIGFLQSVLGGITASIPNLKGPPIKDAKLLRSSGQLIMQGLINGILGEMPTLARQLGRITAQVEANAPQPRVGFVERPTPEAASKIINQYITVHTNELDPERQAIELGWRLAARM